MAPPGGIAIRVTVTGVKQTIRKSRKYRALRQKAFAAALRKFAELARSRVRRAIAQREQLPLKVTKRRVQWFWKSRPNARVPEIKFWVGTGRPVTHNETAKVSPGETQSIEDTAEALTERMIRRLYVSEFPRLIRSQRVRFFGR